MNKKGFLDISFSWIFAFIIGAFIIFGAVYGLGKFTDIETQRSSAVTTTEFGNILNAFETSSESATSSKITFPLQSRIEFDCSKSGQFGFQEIMIEQKANNKWSENGVPITFKSKYIFSENYIEGKEFYAFSKPLEFPFKVANLIYLTHGDKNYCFVDAPRNVKSELSDLDQANLLTKDCEDTAEIKICFDGGSKCDIEVDYEKQIVIKDSDVLPFKTDAMMYAAIFSDKESYECGLSRLMKRAALLADVYMEKSMFLSVRCDSGLTGDLGSFKTSLENYKSIESLTQISNMQETIHKKNKYQGCKLW